MRNQNPSLGSTLSTMVLAILAYVGQFPAHNLPCVTVPWHDNTDDKYDQGAKHLAKNSYAFRPLMQWRPSKKSVFTASRAPNTS